LNLRSSQGTPGNNSFEKQALKGLQNGVYGGFSVKLFNSAAFPNEEALA
jgi:hypothetical protein